jgi:tRNA-dihydrouridine synthase A
MMGWTDRHFRYFMRCITNRAQLYTEMITTGAILCGDRERLLQFHPAEKPLAIQLGGSDPSALARCASIAESYGYDEVNLNVGCPSDRVQNGRFGACLMAEPDLVADCVAAMTQAVALPVTVKTRIGIDQRDSYDELARFVAKLAAAGCRAFIIHARKAWLKGLSPKENREIPPLRHDVVWQIRRDFPHLRVIVNGGIGSMDEAEQQLRRVDGVMIGRAAYHDPYLLATADRRFYDASYPVKSRQQVLDQMIPYIDEALAAKVRLNAIARHMLGLFHGVSGGRRWRRYLTERGGRPGAGSEVLRQAMDQCDDRAPQPPCRRAARPHDSLAACSNRVPVEEAVHAR